MDRLTVPTNTTVYRFPSVAYDGDLSKLYAPDLRSGRKVSKAFMIPTGATTVGKFLCWRSWNRRFAVLASDVGVVDFATTLKNSGR